MSDKAPYAGSLWNEFQSDGFCGLCGNRGIVDTRGIIFSPAGIECGVVRFCICPNGRKMKKVTVGSKWGDYDHGKVFKEEV